MLYRSCALTVLLAVPAYGQFPPLIDLAEDDPDVLIAGATPFAHLGGSMCVGDFNGDELVDLAVVACNATPLGGQRQGEISVVWGPALGAGGTIDLAISQSQVSRIFGKPGDDRIYCELACGDFNKDGFDDIIWGQPGTPMATWQGKAYVILGRPDFPDTLDLVTSPSLFFTIVGHIWTGFLGSGLCACDLNGDGYDEIIVSAPGIEYAETYVIQGADSFQDSYYTGGYEPGMTRIIDDEWWRGTGDLMACEDVDRDGCEDLLMGGPGMDFYINVDGQATLVYGSPQLPDTLSLSSGSWPNTTIYAEYEHGYLGTSVAIGDVDRNGAWDLVLGASAADPLGCEDCGEVYVLHDAATLPDSVPVNSMELPITRVLGNGSDGFGYRLLVDDLTGDFYDEIVAGAVDAGVQRAQATVVYGHRLLADTVFQQTDTTLTRIVEETLDSHFAHSMASGDLNGDHVNDLVIAATYASPLGRSYAGAAYVLYGVGWLTGARTPEFPPALVVEPNYPNPFSSSTWIRFSLPRASAVTVMIYDVLGRRVATLSRPGLGPGEQRILWDGRDERGRRVSSGVYFYRVEAGGVSETRKAVLTR